METSCPAFNLNISYFIYMTLAYFILEEPSTDLLAQSVSACMKDHNATPQGGIAFHGSTLVQAMTAPIPPNGLLGDESRCNNDQCNIREQCRRWLFRDDPWRHESPRWRYGGPSCDWKLLLENPRP